MNILLAFYWFAQGVRYLGPHYFTKKLEYYGIRGSILELFKLFLSCRKQYVSFDGISSSFIDITCGVPQGSILGPLLFIIYINDIVNCSEVFSFILFANNTNRFHSDTDFVRLMKTVNVELIKLSKWF